MAQREGSEEDEFETLEIPRKDPGFWTKTSLVQLGYGIWVNMILVGVGLAQGFAAIAIPQLKKEESNVKISLRDEAWIASVMYLSAPVGCIASGLILDRFGRRITMILCEVPFALGWLCVAIATSALHIIIGLSLGIGLGMAATAPRAYITEFTLPNMRGVISALINIAISVGLTALAALGSLFDWIVLSQIIAVYSVVLLVLNCFLPESPYYTLIKGTPVDTIRSLRCFRAKNFDISEEMQELMEFKAANNIHRLSFREEIRCLFKPSACKPFGIVTMYVTFMQCSGVSVVMLWAVEMLQMSYCSVDAHFGNFLLGTTRVTFGLIVSILLLYVGRRYLAITSALCVGAFAISIGLHITTHPTPSVYPLLLYVGYVASATLGYYTLPCLILYELAPLQIRGILGGMEISIICLLIFGANQMYPSMRNNLGIDSTFLIYGTVSLIGAVCLFHILPETKGLTLREIEEYYNRTRVALVSKRTMSLVLKRSGDFSKGQLVLYKKPKGRWKRFVDVFRKNKHAQDVALRLSKESKLHMASPKAHRTKHQKSKEKIHKEASTSDEKAEDPKEGPSGSSTKK